MDTKEKEKNSFVYLVSFVFREFSFSFQIPQTKISHHN
jgi:hypothetical protein